MTKFEILFRRLFYNQCWYFQNLCIGPALSTRCDILGAAETGSGKTLAFGIPIIAGIYRHNLKTEEKLHVQALRQKTIDNKLKKKSLEIYSDEEQSSSESECQDNEFEEASEDDIEVYMDNGPDGIMEISYDELENNKKKSSENLTDSNDDDDEQMNVGEEVDLSEDEMENHHEENDSEEDDSEDDSEEDETDIDALDGNNEDSESDSGDFDVDSNDAAGYDSDGEEDSSRCSNSSLVSDLGTDDEEDMSDDDKEIGCVRVINNVIFPFTAPKQLEDDGKPKLRALILTPTRELAVQVSPQRGNWLCR